MRLNDKVYAAEVYIAQSAHVLDLLLGRAYTCASAPARTRSHMPRVVISSFCRASWAEHSLLQMLYRTLTVFAPPFVPRAAVCSTPCIGRSVRANLSSRPLHHRSTCHKGACGVVAATPEAAQRSTMAASVLSKPHRFILVSDLDWTMVSAPCSLSSPQWREHKSL
jgi:hypothetical protein